MGIPLLLLNTSLGSDNKAETILIFNTMKFGVVTKKDHLENKSLRLHVYPNIRK